MVGKPLNASYQIKCILDEHSEDIPALDLQILVITSFF